MEPTAVGLSVPGGRSNECLLHLRCGTSELAHDADISVFRVQILSCGPAPLNLPFASTRLWPSLCENAADKA